jgi:hypothetical protein
MVDGPETDEQRALIAEIASRRVPLREIGYWYAPWALATVLALICLAALWTASVATDDGGYAVGLIGAATALGALIWELQISMRGRPITLSSYVLVDDEVSLLVLIAILIALALGGLILAAGSESATARGVGYGLAFFGVVLIFLNLKHYFDVREPRA